MSATPDTQDTPTTSAATTTPPPGQSSASEPEPTAETETQTATEVASTATLGGHTPPPSHSHISPVSAPRHGILHSLIHPLRRGHRPLSHRQSSAPSPTAQVPSGNSDPQQSNGTTPSHSATTSPEPPRHEISHAFLTKAASIPVPTVSIAMKRNGKSNDSTSRHRPSLTEQRTSVSHPPTTGEPHRPSPVGPTITHEGTRPRAGTVPARPFSTPRAGRADPAGTQTYTSKVYSVMSIPFPGDTTEGVDGSESVSDSADLKLSLFVSVHSRNFPKRVKVCKGFCSRSTDVSISQDEIFDFHFLKHTKVITMCDSNGMEYSVPLNSAAQFGILYDVWGNDTMALSTRPPSFDTVGEIMALKNMPAVVCAKKAYNGGHPEHSISAGEVLIISGIKSSAHGRMLKVFSITHGKKHLHEECTGSFSTNPTDTKMPLATMFQNAISFPQKALLFPSAEISHAFLSGALRYPFTLKQYRDETSVIATCPIVMQTVPQEPGQAIDIPVDLDVEVRGVELSINQACRLRLDSYALYKSFEPSKLTPYFEMPTLISYQVQCALHTNPSAANKLFGVQLVMPNSLLRELRTPTPDFLRQHHTRTPEGGDLSPNRSSQVSTPAAPVASDGPSPNFSHQARSSTVPAVSDIDNRLKGLEVRYTELQTTLTGLSAQVLEVKMKMNVLVETVESSASLRATQQLQTNDTTESLRSWCSRLQEEINCLRSQMSEQSLQPPKWKKQKPVENHSSSRPTRKDTQEVVTNGDGSLPKTEKRPPRKVMFGMDEGLLQGQVNGRADEQAHTRVLQQPPQGQVPSRQDASATIHPGIPKVNDRPHQSRPTKRESGQVPSRDGTSATTQPGVPKTNDRPTLTKTDTGRPPSRKDASAPTQLRLPEVKDHPPQTRPSKSEDGELPSREGAGATKQPGLSEVKDRLNKTLVGQLASRENGSATIRPPLPKPRPPQTRPAERETGQVPSRVTASATAQPGVPDTKDRPIPTKTDTGQPPRKDASATTQLRLPEVKDHPPQSRPIERKTGQVPSREGAGATTQPGLPEIKDHPILTKTAVGQLPPRRNISAIIQSPTPKPRPPQSRPAERETGQVPSRVTASATTQPGISNMNDHHIPTEMESGQLPFRGDSSAITQPGLPEVKDHPPQSRPTERRTGQIPSREGAGATTQSGLAEVKDSTILNKTAVGQLPSRENVSTTIRLPLPPKPRPPLSKPTERESGQVPSKDATTQPAFPDVKNRPIQTKPGIPYMKNRPVPTKTDTVQPPSRQDGSATTQLGLPEVKDSRPQSQLTERSDSPIYDRLDDVLKSKPPQKENGSPYSEPYQRGNVPLKPRPPSLSKLPQLQRQDGISAEKGSRLLHPKGGVSGRVPYSLGSHGDKRIPRADQMSRGMGPSPVTVVDKEHRSMTYL